MLIVGKMLQFLGSYERVAALLLGFTDASRIHKAALQRTPLPALAVRQLSRSDASPPQPTT